MHLSDDVETKGHQVANSGSQFFTIELVEHDVPQSVAGPEKTYDLLRFHSKFQTHFYVRNL